MKVAPPPRALSTPTPGRPAGQAPAPSGPVGTLAPSSDPQEERGGSLAMEGEGPTAPLGAGILQQSWAPWGAAGPFRLHSWDCCRELPPAQDQHWPPLLSPLLSSSRATCSPPPCLPSPLQFRSSCEAPPRDPCGHRDPAGQGDIERQLLSIPVTPCCLSGGHASGSGVRCQGLPLGDPGESASQDSSSRDGGCPSKTPQPLRLGPLYPCSLLTPPSF